jgi:hypothetical protein
MRLPINKLRHGAKVRAGSAARRTGRFVGGHKKMVGGGAAIGLGAAGLMGRSGRAADKPNGRPTGPYMY